MFETEQNFTLNTCDIIGIINFIIYYLCKLGPKNRSSIEAFQGLSSLLQFSFHNTFIFIFLISHFNSYQYLPLA